jgi:hypothetical protein
LSGIIIANLSGAKGKARDAKRISDVGNLQLALELYFDRCNRYPAGVSGTLSFDDANCPKQNSTAGRVYKMIDFISSLPVPTNEASPSQTNYYYVTNGTYTDYVLRANLESSNAAVLDGLPSNSLDSTCSNATGSKYFCLGPK